MATIYQGKSGLQPHMSHTHQHDASVAKVNPRSEPEFFGLPGALFLSICLPAFVYALFLGCNDVTGCPAFTIASFDELYSARTTIYTISYFCYCLLLYSFLPGQDVLGTTLSTGERLKYRCNAWQASLVTIAALAYLTLLWDMHSFWAYIWDHYVEFVTANLGISITLATFVYLRSFKSNALLAEGGQTSVRVYDWFIGRELNPRTSLPWLGTIDIKFFCELRPGLLGWLILDFAFAVHQDHQHGLSDSMVLVVFFQSLYILDSFYNEAAMLTTIDITTDGFGFMLALGDLVCVPFIYSLPARYLAMHPVHLGAPGVLAILAVHFLGYHIFRSSNSEKDLFRSNPQHPKVAKLKYLTTASGSKLLVSGWWGTARHINYLGDWLMAWSWCLPTGLAGFTIDKGVVPMPGWGMPISYFYVLWLGALLLHREMRDEEKCARKYGADWQKNKSIVRWRIIPWVY